MGSLLLDFLVIDGYEVIQNIENASIDPQETQEKVKILIRQNPEILSEKTEAALIAENVVFSRLGPNQKHVDDAEGKVLQSILDTLNAQKRLLLSGEIISDLRGTEYWIKESGKWKKAKIEILGENLPLGAVVPDDLSRSQDKEIKEQSEAERIAALTPEEKAEERESALAAARHAVRLLKEDAEAVGESFDAPAEYQSRKAAIQEKYA
jgi:hypothetical protein